MGILDGTILSEDQREEMWDPIGSYAMGWDVGSADSGQRVVGKAGGQPGANAYLRIYPDDGIVISVLSNRQRRRPQRERAEPRDRRADARRALAGFHRGVDGEGASRPRHRHAVVPVANGVAVAHAHHADRRQRRRRGARPSTAAPSGSRTIELGRNAPSNRTARLGSTVPAIASSGISSRAGRPLARRFVSSYTGRRPRAAAPQPPCQRGTAASARLPREGPLGVHLG